MTHQPAAPVEADAPRPLARAILHARIPVALKLLLLALLAALSMADAPRRTWHLLRKDWFISATTAADEDPDSGLDWYSLRRFRRRRARLGWLLRCDRAEGMALAGQRAPAPCPAQAARAPPRHKHARNHLESVAKTPLSAAISRARFPVSYPRPPRWPVAARKAQRHTGRACRPGYAPPAGLSAITARAAPGRSRASRPSICFHGQ